MQTISNSPTRKQGVLMFTILITAYVVFATNWVAGSTLSKQITDYYFNGEKVSPIISEVVNYTITISRIIANLLAAFILIKLHPKKAAMISLFCLCFSFFAIFTHSYWLYTISRMIMGFGGSMIIVFINSFVAKFIPNDKKIITSTIITAAYNIGAALVAILFLLFKKYFVIDWRYTMIGFSIFSIILLAFWILFSRDFEPTVTWKHPNHFVYESLMRSKEAIHQVEEKKYTYADGFKDKFIYIFSLGFGGFLFLYVMPLVSLPRVITEHANNPHFKPEVMILTVTIGGLFGTLFSLLVTRRLDFRRKPFLMIHGVLMIGFMAIGLLCVSNNVIISYIMFALSGFFMYSQYPIYLNIPYELPKMNSQRLTIMFGIFWAFGYAIYTLFNFSWSLVLNHMGYNASLIFYLVGSLTYIIFVTEFPETRPKTSNIKLKIFGINVVI